MFTPWKESYDKPGQLIKKPIHHFADKGPHSQSHGFSSSHAQIWELDHKEGWVLENWCFRIVVLKKTLESLLDSKIKPVNPKGNQPWVFNGKTDAEAEAPIFWPPDMKSRLIRKDPDAEKRLKAGGEGDDRGCDGGMVSPNQCTWVWASSGRWWRQGSLACCSPWGCKKSDMTEWLNSPCADVSLNYNSADSQMRLSVSSAYCWNNNLQIIIACNSRKISFSEDMNEHFIMAIKWFLVVWICFYYALLLLLTYFLFTDYNFENFFICFLIAIFLLSPFCFPDTVIHTSCACLGSYKRRPSMSAVLYLWIQPTTDQKYYLKI